MRGQGPLVVYMPGEWGLWDDVQQLADDRCGTPNCLVLEERGRWTLVLKDGDGAVIHRTGQHFIQTTALLEMKKLIAEGP